jgi:hypothetical protein
LPFVLGFVLVLAVPFTYVKIGSFTYSEGERTGTVTKLSHKGLLLKTWEGELNMGGLEVGGKSSVWQFSVDDPAIIEDIKKAQRAGGRWTLKYRQQAMKQSWKGSTDYFITEVIPAGKE